MDKILKCDLSSENYGAVLSCGIVYYAVQGGYLLEAWCLDDYFGWLKRFNAGNFLKSLTGP